MPSDSKTRNSIQWGDTKVFLTPEEAYKLLDVMDMKEFGYWVDALDAYLRKKPNKTYKNHYLVIRNWHLRQQKRPFFAKEYDTPKEVY